MLRNICTVYQVVIILCLPSVYGQTIQPHILCSDVSAPAGYSGVVEYLQEESSTSCTLVLTGLANGSYVSIPGVNSTTGQPCPSVIINSQSYCIKGTDLGDSVIIQLVNNYLNFTSTSQTTNFTLHYYNQVLVDEMYLDFDYEPGVDQLSGILTTSYDPMQLTGAINHHFDIFDIPNLPTPIQFEVLRSEGSTFFAHDDGYVAMSSRGAPAGSSVLYTADTRRVGINFSQDMGIGLYQLMLKFQILHCGDIPTIPNTNHTIPDTPWLPDAEVTYECVDGWKLKPDTNSTIECIVDRNKEIAVWTDHSNIQCVQVECEVPEEFYNIANGVVTDKIYYYTQQLQYLCDVGYVRDVVVNCTKDGSWSVLPLCVPSPTTTSQTGRNGVAVGVGTTVGVIVVSCLIVGVVCGCRKYRRKSTSYSEDVGDVTAALNLKETAAEVQSSDDS